MNKIEPAIRAALAVLAMTPAASAANAGRSQSHAPFGAALAAMIIGETCPNALTPPEVLEIKRYIDQQVAIEKARSPEDKAEMERLVPELEADYRSNRTCGIGDDEIAKDMLLRVRKEVETVR